MKLRFRGSLDLEDFRNLGITRASDKLILRHRYQDRERIQKELYRIDEKNKKNHADGKEPVELDITIDIQYKKRSVESNNLMWALYTIIADVLTRERADRNRTTAQELYEDDMRSFAPVHEITCPQDSSSFFFAVLEQERGHIIETRNIDGQVIFTIQQTSSYWDSRRMKEHIERLLLTLADMKITKETNGDLDRIFADFELWKNKEEQPKTLSDEPNGGFPAFTSENHILSPKPPVTPVKSPINENQPDFEIF